MMEVLALVISIFSLIIGSLAYIRSGGGQNIRSVEHNLNQKIEELRALVYRAGESLVANVRAGYQRSIRAIDELKALGAALSDVAVDEIRQDLKALFETLEKLADRAVREANNVKTGMTAIVVEAEETLRHAVDEARARLAVIEAKQLLILARLSVGGNNLAEAESHVEAAISHLQRARSLTSEHTESLETVQRQAQRMLTEIRVQSDSLKASLDSLIERNNRLLSEMSYDASSFQPAARRVSG
jgi:hypothetical protein